jgi:hypothetical protein
MPRPDYRTHAQRAADRDRRDMRRDRMRRERESMTPAQVEAAARRLIRERMQRDGDQAEISMDDFKRANLPMQLVTQDLVRRLVRAMRDDLQMERT